jgi:uncharacterized protein (TIGR02453 family)
MAYSGFPKETLRYLKNLGAHNSWRWFEDHHPDYFGDVLEPARELVAAIGPRLKAIDPELQAVPQVNASIMRLNRDLRFQPKQPPFKGYLELWFWRGTERSFERPGFFLRLSPTKLEISAGIRRLKAPLLDSYRTDVFGGARGEPLVSIVKSLKKKGYEIGGQTYARPPSGVGWDHPRVSLLRHSALHASWTGRYPKEFATGAFVGFVLKHFAAMAPLHAWLTQLSK